jgi:poly(3-hydroxyalkanoate) synthetase
VKTRLPTPRRPIHSLRNARDRFLHARDLIQAGKTSHRIIHRHDIVSVRAYPVAENAHATPLVIVPPLAVNMLIYDLFPQRSLVRFYQEQGFRVYMIDWGRPGSRQNSWNFATYLKQLMPECLQHIRLDAGTQRLSLHGWSMGGIFSYCYAALGDPDIANLVLLGPPCDYHAPGGVNWQNRLVAKQMRQLERVGWNVHGTHPRWWRSPGWANSLAFKLASPAGTVRGYTDLLRNLHDRDFVTNHATHAAFLDDMVAYPGGVIQDVLQYLLTDNVLAAGRLPIRDCEASLKAVQQPVLMVLGKHDPIISPASSQQLRNLLGSTEIETLQVPGGHMSIVSGSQAPTSIWEPTAAWLAQRSGGLKRQQPAA